MNRTIYFQPRVIFKFYALLKTITKDQKKMKILLNLKRKFLRLKQRHQVIAQKTFTTKIFGVKNYLLSLIFQFI